MKLLALHALNFRTLRDFRFDFPQTPGLYYITGSNLDAPALGSNGVGKSTLWEAINFALEGETSNRLKGPDLCRDGERTTRVEIVTDAGTLARTWSRDRKLSLILDGKEVAQDEVRRRFVLDREQFLAAHCIPQTHTLFVDMKPAAQIETLQRLLAMDRWADYADRASKRASNLQRLLDDVAEQLARALGELDGLDIAQLQQAVDQWVEDHARRVLELERSLENEPTPVSTEAVEKRLAGTNTAIKRAQMAQRSAAQRSNDLSIQIGNNAGEMRRLEAELQRIAKRNGFFGQEMCPTCAQPIAAKHRDACWAEGDRLTKEAEAAYFKFEESLKAATELHKEASASEARARQRLHELDVQRRQCERELDQIRTGNEAQVRARAELERRLRLVRGEPNTLRPLLDSALRRISEVEETIALLRYQYEEDERRTQAVALWARGFKMIRSQLVSEALLQFSIDIAGVVDDLGLQGWRIQPLIDPAVFESVRAQSGFRFVITEPGGIERSLEAYSGGEGQRVRLAIQLGLASMIGALSEARWDFEVWDEPSTYLSEEGVQALFRSLRDRALRLERPVFVIDHHQSHFGDLDGVYRLVKEGNETRLEE